MSIEEALADLEALRDRFREYGENHLRFVNGHTALTYDQGSGEAFLACSRDLDTAIKKIRRSLGKEYKRGHQQLSAAEAYEQARDHLDAAMLALSAVSRDLAGIPNPDHPDHDALVLGLEIRAAVAQLEVTYSRLAAHAQEEVRHTLAHWH